MNQLIEDFISQAGTDCSGKWMSVRDAQHLAELIVRECDRYVAEHYDECEPWMSPGDLLKHFGVES